MRLNINDLIRKKEAVARVTKDIEIPALGGSIEIRKLPLAQFLEMMDSFNDKTTTSEAVKLQIEAIYESCQILHSSELQNAFECAEPTDIVCKVLGDDLSEIARIFNEIMAFYGMAEEEIKNS